MRIAFYAPMKAPTDPHPSGERQMARLLWAALERAGYEVELASTFRSYDGGGCSQRQQRLAALGGRLAERMTGRFCGKAASLRPALWFTYHLYHKAPDGLGPTVSRALGIPYVVAEASSAPRQARGRWAAGYRAANEAIATADLVILLNRADRLCVAPLIADKSRLVDLPPFVDAAAFRLAERDRHRLALAKRLDLETDEPVLLTVAMMRHGDKLNSYRVLGRALSLIADRRWTLLVAGDGPARAEVERALAAVGDRVRWLGRVATEALPAVYASADLYVWPAVNEAYGVALLEAQAAGVPVVAGRCGGVPDVVADGDTGRLVPVGDAPAFARAVARLLDDPASRLALAGRASLRAATRHDIASASSVLAVWLERLVRNKEPDKALA